MRRYFPLLFAIAILAIALGAWFLVGLEPKVGGEEPLGKGVRGVATAAAGEDLALREPGTNAGAALAPVDGAHARSTPESRPWTLRFSVEETEDGGSAEAPVFVIAEGRSGAHGEAVWLRSTAGIFQLEVELREKELRGSTVYCAHGPDALDARSGIALRMDRLGAGMLLGQCRARDGAWDDERRVVDLGAIALRAPTEVGTFAVVGGEPEDLEVVVEFFQELAVPTPETLKAIPVFGEELDHEWGSGPFGRARFPLDAAAGPIPFGTFGAPKTWIVEAYSPDLHYLTRGNDRLNLGEAPSCTLGARVGGRLQLMLGGQTGLDFSIDLSRMRGARQVLIRPADASPAFSLTLEQLNVRIQEVAVTTIGLSEKLSRQSNAVELGDTPLPGGKTYVIEVWSQPSGGEACALLHSETVKVRFGFKKFMIR